MCVEQDNQSMQNQTKRDVLPEFFRPILWSFDFDKIDLKKHKKTIILNSINYGDLKHWKWITKYYGYEAIREVLSSVSSTELRSRVLNLAGLVFSIKNFNYAFRGVK